MGNEPAIGTYITGDGQSYVVIERGQLGDLRVTGGRILIVPGYFAAPTDRSIDVSLDGGRLVISQDETYSDPAGGSREIRAWSVLTFDPSTARPGDWDLIIAEMSSSSGGAPAIVESRFWERLLEPGGGSKLAGAFRPRPEFVASLPLRDSPLRSFLSRVDDPHLVEYIDLRRSGGDPARIFELARALNAGSPDNALLRLHAVEQEAANGDTAEARRLWDQWDAAHGATTDTLHRQIAMIVWRHLAAAEFKRDYPDIERYTETFAASSKGADPTTRHKALRDALAIDRLMIASWPLITPEPLDESTLSLLVPDFIETQNQPKHDCAWAMTAENRDEGLSLLAANYRLGQSLNAAGLAISQLAGMSVRTITSEGFAAYILSAAETPEEARAVWDTLQRLHQTPEQEDGSQLMYGETGRLIGLMESPMARSFDEAATRHYVADAKFQTVRVAAAIQAYTIANNAPPAKASDLSQWFPTGLPIDPFTAGATSLILTTTGESSIIRSIGPDRLDDAAAIRYDPTNGTTSAGDIFIEIPRP